MKSTNKKNGLLVSLLIGFIALSSNANASLISFNDFFADPTVSVVADGSSALIEEDSNSGAALLVNDPFFGDLEVIIAAANSVLSFDYLFTEGQGNIDQFRVTLFEAPTLEELENIFFTESQSGTVSFNLGAFIGRTLGLQFELRSLDDITFLDSTVAISNLSIKPAEEVSSPSVLLLMMGMTGLLFIKRKNRN